MKLLEKLHQRIVQSDWSERLKEEGEMTKESALWKLEFLLNDLKRASDSLKSTAAENEADKDVYMQGIGSGMKIASNQMDHIINSYEKTLAELQGYMVEDVDLSGGEEIA